MNVLINVRIYDFNQYRENVYIIFNEKIEKIGDMKTFKDNGYNIIEGNNNLVIPSLVVGHTHIYSTLSRGLILPFNPTNFQEILDQLWWKIDKHLDIDDIYYSGIVSGVDYIRNGVTTIIDHHASGVAIKGSLDTLKQAICNDVGMRGIFCFETSDRFDVDQCIKENLNFINNNQEDNCIGLFGMHASLSLSEETLEKISHLISDIPIHIHVAESELDQENCIKNYGERVIMRLNRHKLLNKNSILSHCIHINENEGKIIKENGCYVALNTSSNMNNSVGLPDYNLFKKLGIKCLIGNDGMSSGITTEYQNLLFSMHHQLKSPTAFDLSDLIKIINNNYDYVNKMMGIKIGRIEKGYEADMLMFPYTPPTPINNDNAFGHLFYGLFNSFKPKHVWCSGKQIVANYKVSSSLNKKYSKAQNVAKKLWDTIKKGDV